MSAADTPSDLVALGLRKGDRVRFRRTPKQRWQEGRVERVERDGSLGVRDRKGASRCFPIELVEVRRAGPRGGTVWARVVEAAAATEQLDLL